MGAVFIQDGNARLGGELNMPPDAKGAVLFAHGSGSSRFSPRNTYVAGVLQQHGMGTLLFDLLTPEEDENYSTRFDIGLLARRLLIATEWMRDKASRLGYFGASTGAAAALVAASKAQGIQAIVSRGGRPDLAGETALRHVKSPTLLIVGSHDYGVIELNQEAYELMGCEKKMILIEGATHLFEEPGTLEQAAKQAAAWFVAHFNAGSGRDKSQSS